MELLKRINRNLELYYGCELDGRARYRVVWSTKEFETRCGEFNEFYGPIFLRTVVGVKKVPKYPYDKDRWILEKMFFIRHPEILTEKPGCYEPLYVLKRGTGEYLPLNWRAIQVAVDFAESRPVGIKLTDKDWSLEEQKAIEAEAQYFEEELNEQGRSPLFAFENSVFIDSRKVSR